jgi:CTP synthase (UTP-ammonia lyase)
MTCIHVNDVIYHFKLGGTIGDIESMPFVEAFRQLQFRIRKENLCVVHVSLVPQVCLTAIGFSR